MGRDRCAPHSPGRHPRQRGRGGLRTGRVNNSLYDAYQDTDVGAVLLAASEYGVAINHVNRSMGLSDVYPFVLRERHIEKLKLAHRYLQPGPPK
ncbi:MAG: putative zinc-binding metallopeptidase [Polyangiales bacterium]